MTIVRQNIYDERYVDKLVEDDEITVQEAGFMHWYDQPEAFEKQD